MNQSLELIERSGELQILDSALRSSVTDGGLVVIEGAAGIGKSRLIEVVKEKASGFTTLAARAGALEQDIAFGVTRQLFEPMLRKASGAERKRLLKGAAVRSAQVLGIEQANYVPISSDLRGSLNALYWLMANLAERGPVLATVDDIHWADRASLEFLVYLARRLEGLPVLVVTAVRSGESSPHKTVIDELVGQAEVVSPAPLSRDGVAELMRVAFGGPAPDELIEACHTATGGNPFYLEELLRAVAASSADPEAIAVDTIRATVPSTIARSILLRLGRLPEPAPRLAVAAARLGDDTALRHVAALAGVSVHEAEPAADTLVKASIFAEVHPVRFAHPIVRAAIASDAPPAERAAAHRRAAELLKAAAEPLERIVPHLLLASRDRDQWTVEALHAAARSAIGRGVPDTAVLYLRRALEEPPVSGHAALFADLSLAELASGAYRESASSARQAMEMSGDRGTRVKMRLQQAYALLSVEGASSAVTSLEQALLETGDEDPQLALQLEGEIVLVSWLGDAAHPLQDRLGRYRDLKGSSYGELFMLAVLAMEALRNNEPAEAVRNLALRGLSRGRLLEMAPAHALAYYSAVLGLLAAEAYEEAQQAIATGLKDCVKRGSQFGFAGVCWVSGLLALAEGNLPLAEAHQRACIENAVPTMAGIGIASLAQVLLEQGEVAAAYYELEKGGLLADERAIYMCGPYVRGLVRLEQGDPASALADFDDVGRHATEVGGFAAWLPWQIAKIRALHACGERDAAQRLAEMELEQARGYGGARRLGVALRTAALVSSGGDRLQQLAAAVDVLAASPARLEMARARYDLGVALLRAGSRRAGREQLESCHDLARSCGAIGLAEAAQEELRIAGARPRLAQFSGVEALTASERRVAELAAGGKTNREIAQALFVTPKTVENQLGRVYGKLDVCSRRALREALCLQSVPRAGRT